MNTIKTWNERIDLTVEMMGRLDKELTEACDRFVNNLDFDALHERLDYVVVVADSEANGCSIEQQTADCIAQAALNEFLQSELDGELVYRLSNAKALVVSARKR